MMSNRIFPEEKNVGTVEIVDDTIICTDSMRVYSSETKIALLQYAYIELRKNGEKFLYLHDYTGSYIPVDFRGFGTMYRQISDTFGFDDDLFFEQINQHNIDCKKAIWRKKTEPTYQILSEKHNDYHLGFEIQASVKEFISWDIAFNKLERNEHAYLTHSFYEPKQLNFKYPIRVGNILLFNFSIRYPWDRNDFPISYSMIECFNHKSNNESYIELKTLLSKDLREGKKIDMDCVGNIQKLLFDTKQGIILSIAYSYDSKWTRGFERGCTILLIDNKREYPAYLIDKEYESKLVVSDYLLLENVTAVPGDYRHNPNVKRRPPSITCQFQDKTIIWIDNMNNKIGISGEQCAYMYAFEEILSFYLQNVLPAKGNGSSTLFAELAHRKYSIILFTASCNALDQYAEKIASLINKPVDILPDDYDC